MKPVKFDQQNVVFAENQEEYLPLPAFRTNQPTGDVITCWELSPEELEEVQKTGKVWLRQLTFGQPLQSVNVEGVSPFKIICQNCKTEITAAEYNSFDGKCTDCIEISVAF